MKNKVVNNYIKKMAHMYVKHGKAVIPIGRETKIPTVKWKEIQSRLPYHDEIEAWWSRDNTNIAMLTGAISGNIFVIDADGEKAVEYMDKNFPKTSVYTLTLNGKHAYYSMPPNVIVRNRVNFIKEVYVPKKSQMDIRGEGGYVLVYPSTRESFKYKWIRNGKGWEDLTVFLPPNCYPENEAFSFAPYQSSGKGNLNIDLSNLSEPVNYNPTAIGQRNNTLAQMVGAFINKGLTQDEVFIWAKGWNIQNTPPLQEKEVIQTIKSIFNTHMLKGGQIVSSPRVVNEKDLEKKDEPINVVSGTEEKDLKKFLYPCGLLEEIIDYIDKGSTASFRLFSLGAALAVIGTLIGQKVMTETGLRTNLYIFALSHSGTGKNAPLSTIPYLLSMANCSDDILGASHLTGGAALLSGLQNRPCQLLFLDEIGDFLAGIKNKNSTAKSDIPQILKELFSSTNIPLEKAYAKADNNVRINWHHLSFYATGVPHRFWENLTFGDITDGFIARSLLFSIDMDIPLPKENIDLKPSLSLIRGLKKLNSLNRAFSGNMRTTPTPIVVKKSEAARAFFNDWRLKYHKLTNALRNSPDGSHAIYARVAEHAHKLALIYEVSLINDIPVEVTLKAVTWACSFLDWITKETISKIKESISINEFEAKQKIILKEIEVQQARNRPGATMRNIMQRAGKGNTTRLMKDLVDSLVLAGEIQAIMFKPNRGPETIVFTTNFTEEESE